jgi:hypothetical protein
VSTVALPEQTIEIQSFLDSNRSGRTPDGRRKWKPITLEQLEHLTALTGVTLVQAVERLRAGEVITSRLGTFHIRLQPAVAKPCPDCGDSRFCQHCRGRGYDPDAVGWQACPICEGDGICVHCRQPAIEGEGV